MTTYVYPVYITYDPDKTECDYLVYIPDMDGYTQGHDLAECIEIARDYIGNYIISVNEIPKPDSVNYKANSNTIKTYVDVNYDLFKLKLNNKPIKKTLTIPFWLNKLGVKANINFSQTLTEALKEKLGV